MWTSSALGT